MTSTGLFYVLNLFTEITDEKRFTEEYARKVPAILAKYGGRYLVRRGNPELVKGLGPIFEAVVILEFPDRDAALRWMTSSEYEEILPIRHATSKSSVHLVEGYVLPEAI